MEEPGATVGIEELVQRPLLNVLFATDGSDHALKAARFLAAALVPAQASVRLLTVVSTEVARQPMGSPDRLGDGGRDGWPEGPEDMADRMQQAAERAVSESRAILEDAGQATMTSVRIGYAPDEILAEILEWHPDLVVVGRRGRSRPSSLLLGSVSDFLLRHSSQPVLVVP